MRKVRTRLLILLVALVILTSMVTIIISWRIWRGLRPDTETLRMFAMGTVVKDIFLLLLCVVIVFVVMLLIEHGTTNPIRILANAANEIAKGNYDVRVAIRQDRVEEYGELQRSFNDMARNLKGNEYLRKDFISGVSHELKTPLAIIEGYAELLQEDDALPPELRREYADAIARESGRLSRMTEDMLRLSRMDEGRQTLNYTEFSLDEQLRRIIIRMEPQWSARELQIVPVLPPVTVRADEALLAEVWQNLLENAIKFSNEGGEIEVRLSMRGGMATVAVRDFGIGMDAETRKHMFERFYQGDTSRGQSGSGLGLSLVRRIVQLHDGLVEADSAPGKGCTVTVTLPAPRNEA